MRILSGFSKQLIHLVIARLDRAIRNPRRL